MGRSMLLLLAITVTACGGKDDADSGDGDALAACVLAGEHTTCPSCSDGEVTCTWGAYEAKAFSCGQCQALGALYDMLCAEGVDASRSELETATCEYPTTY